MEIFEYNLFTFFYSFWPSLLIDTIPLLESKDPKILSKETCIILHHLESDLMPLVQKKKKLLETNPEVGTNIKQKRLSDLSQLFSLNDNFLYLFVIFFFFACLRNPLT